MSQEIWCFKYAPQSLDEMILADDKKEVLKKVIAECPNVLLAGKPGTGKGTFMDIFLKETGYDFLKLNASDENSIDVVRDTVKSFSTSLGFTDKKIVYLNECLEENEEVIIGTTDSYEFIKLKDLPKDKKFNIVSMNQESGILENDEAFINVEKDGVVYELCLEDGRVIQATNNHPFFVIRNGKIKAKLLKHLEEGDEIISF